MKEIRSALVVGAGAVGSIVAATIHGSQPGSVAILADEVRGARFKSEGLVVNGERHDIPLARAGVAPAKGEEPGLVIVAVKDRQLADAISDMKPYVGPDTLVISLMNGISSEDALAEAFGREKVLYAMIIGIDAVREDFATRYGAKGVITFGEAKNPAGGWSEPVSRIASFFDRTGVAYNVPEDMIRSLWFKFMINVGVNQASAVLRAPYATFQRIPEARRVMDAAMLELIAISAKRGTGLVEGDLESWYATLARLAPEAKTSMLQDIEAKRKTEIELFAGTVVKLGEESGVPTPVNRLLFDMIRTIEQGY